MPELPEVETTLRGLSTSLLGATITRIIVRNRNLRWPIPTHISRQIRGRKIIDMQRRGKYILLILDRGGLILHLGMSGSLRVLQQKTTAAKNIKPHEHYDLLVDNGSLIRYHDPRRFGCLLWCDNHPLTHIRIRGLGIEPLSAEFTGDYLYKKAKRRTLAIKNLIMNNQIVVGVGNIYACESLFAARINPLRPCNRISRMRYQRLVKSIRIILQTAINCGGDGTPGYFAQELMVYARANQLCKKCNARIKNCHIGQRSTFYCPKCQR